METPLSPLDFTRRVSVLAFACALASILAGCALDHHTSSPISQVFPAPSRPHLILTADKSEVRKGESVELVVTFMNPTRRRVVMPTSFPPDDDGLARIDHDLEYEWNGKLGVRRGLAMHSIHVCPPSVDYLEPSQQNSYRLRWVSVCEGEGVVALKYEFGWAKDFPPAILKLKTR